MNAATATGRTGSGRPPVQTRAAHAARHVVGAHPFQGGGQGRADRVDVRCELCWIGDVDAQGERTPQLLVVRDECGQGLHQREPGDHVDAYRQVRRHVAERGGGVQPSSRQVHRRRRVPSPCRSPGCRPGPERPRRSRGRSTAGRATDRDAPVRAPSSACARRAAGRTRRARRNGPRTRARTVASRRRWPGPGARARSEQRHGEVDHRGPRAVQRLQHHGGALGEERGHLVVVDLVADLRARPRPGR